MLAALDAQELNDWRTFELSEGPLDRSYEREVLAQILEHLKVLILTTAQREPPSSEEWPRINRPYIEIDEDAPLTEDEKDQKEAEEKQATIAGLDAALGYI